MFNSFIFVLFIFVLYPYLGFLSPTQRGTGETILKIVGGRNSLRGRWPWQAVVILTQDEVSGFTICGGTLIHTRWVLTSASCLRDYNNVDVVLGVWNITDRNEEGRAFFTSTRLEIHPCYEEDRLTGTNIGLIQLDGMARREHVLCLPNNFFGDWADLIRGDTLHGCVATGFGRTEYPGPPSILQQVAFQNISKRLCETSYGSRVSNDKICASGANGEDTCDGDIGGPLVCHSTIYRGRCRGRYLAGVILADSSNCGSDESPSVYTAVFPHVRWIQRIIQSRRGMRPSITSDTIVGYGCNDRALPKSPNSTGPSLTFDPLNETNYTIPIIN